MTNTFRVLRCGSRGFTALMLAGWMLAGCAAFGTGTAQAAISGTVVDEHGQPLDGLEVALFDGKEFSFGAALAHSRTQADGSFTLDARLGQGAVLGITGAQGTGRVVLPASGDVPPIEYPVRKKIVLLHDNDQHFDFNEREVFMAAVQETRERYPDVFLFNAGDIFVRHPHRWVDEDGNLRDEVWYSERAMRIVAIMNQVGYDAMVLGNHEMDVIGTYTGAALSAARFPLLAANYEGRAEQLPPLQPYAVFTTHTGRTVGVLGIATGTVPAGLQRLDRGDTVEKYSYLRDEHDVLVALTHIGMRNDRVLASEYPVFDVIIGGHSHTLLEEGEMVGPVLIAQAGGGGHVTSRQRPKYLGKVVLVLENGRIVDKTARVTVFTPAPEEELSSMERTR